MNNIMKGLADTGRRVGFRAPRANETKDAYKDALGAFVKQEIEKNMHLRKDIAKVMHGG